MKAPPVRPDVVDALVATHRSTVPWAGLAAVAFEPTPPPTAAERAGARRIVRERHLLD